MQTILDTLKQNNWNKTKTAKALGIDRSHTGHLLTESPLWIEDHDDRIPEGEIVASPRVGIDYAGEDAYLPYRFRVRHSKWTSPAK